MSSMHNEWADSLETADIRHIQLRLLKNFARFCENNDLLYMLSAGTLLGAIRHRGFIPWDDDVDVMMPRADFQRLIDLRHTLKSYVGADLRYSTGVSDLYPFPFSKLCDPNTTLIESYSGAGPLGVNIDIFPIDTWPTGRVRRALRREYLRFLSEVVLSLKTWTAGRPRRFPAFIYRIGRAGLAIIPTGLVIRRITQVASRQAMRESTYGGILVGGCREVIKMTDLIPTSVGHFEDCEYRIPGNSHAFLAALYGDYMTLPAVEKRIRPHEFYVLDVPMSVYLNTLTDDDPVSDGDM